MDKRKLIIIGSLVVIVGIGGYFGYQWYNKNKKKKEEGKDSSDSSNTDTGSSNSTMNITTNAPIVATTKFSFPSTWTKADGDKFRAWVNDNYPSYAKQISLDRSGSLNAYVDTAYKVYGTTYLNSLKSFYFKVGDKVKALKGQQNVTKWTKTTSGTWSPTSNKMNLSTADTFTVAGYATANDGNRYVVIAPIGTTNSFLFTSESNLAKV